MWAVDNVYHLLWFGCRKVPQRLIRLNMPEDGAVLEGAIGSGTSLNSSLATLTVTLCFLSRDIM